MKALTSLLLTLGLITTLVAHPNHHHKTEQVPLHLIEVHGSSDLNSKIRKLQKRLETSPKDAALIEKLGWLLISKARSEADHGLYEHAFHCANQLVEIPSAQHQGQLLLGHLYLQEHRFTEAKKVARQLVKERGWHYDYGLLGDILLDLGDTDAATKAYQAMMSQRPGLESYARAALIRWQRGHVDSAIEAMELAVAAGSLRNPEPLAWAYSKLAGFYLQKGNVDRVHSICAEALKVMPGYPQAQLMKGRAFMAQSKFTQALPFLSQAAKKLPEPAFLWAWRDCLVESGKIESAWQVESQLHETGVTGDARTYALFLATVDQKTELALSLSHNEIQHRTDIFTHDALAWSHFANGELKQAQSAMAKALAEGTQDARLSLHAGIIAAKAGDADTASKHFADAERASVFLLPSEQKLLDHRKRDLPTNS